MKLRPSGAILAPFYLALPEASAPQNEFPDAGLGGKLLARETSTTLLTPGALWVTGSCDAEISPMAIYRAMELSVTPWRAKAARVRAEGGCVNRHSPVAVLAHSSEVLPYAPSPTKRVVARLLSLFYAAYCSLMVA